MHLLGIDIGSSSVKVALVDAETSACIAKAFSPATEMLMDAPRPGWAEQDPREWELHTKLAIGEMLSKSGIHPKEIAAIGIGYQMHGLVCCDKVGNVLRPAIIWCDSRAVETGKNALTGLGPDFCISHYLNSPGNFTVSKLKWVKENEPEIYREIDSVMLPGDYLAFRMTGERFTTRPGLSEAILWDFKDEGIASDLLKYYGIRQDLIPPLAETFGFQGSLSGEAADYFGLQKGTPVCYRAGDQPNNAFSLNVLQPGEVAATAGTSGVLYAVTDLRPTDKASRVNTFIHVNDTKTSKRNGVLLCINGTGISNSWLKKITGNTSYEAMNTEAANVPAGSEDLVFLPFGNGAERILENRSPGASFHNLDFNIHKTAHLFRAVQEGIACSFYHGMQIMAGMGIQPKLIRAGHENMFLSAVFAASLADLSQVTIELYNTNGATGAALGAGIGAGVWTSAEEAFRNLNCIKTIHPEPANFKILSATYEEWLKHLNKQIQD